MAKSADAPHETTTPVYRYKDGLYVNLTNKCPTACRFCIKFTWKMKYRGYDLKLRGHEPSIAEVMAGMEAEDRKRPFSEIVFCGYGESTYRLDDMIAICAEVKKRWPKVRRRLNTIGLGDAINKRPISKDLARGLDAVSVSINTADPKQWEDIVQPMPEFKATGFEAVKRFIRECAAAIPDTTVTAVEQPGVDIDACRVLAESLGARWRERPYLDEYEAG
ncbi:MAG: radical SAM protein [Elusimicrobia bacterium]|nr:radical SAM protein [Elusimicrobiota bacterium]